MKAMYGVGVLAIAADLVLLVAAIQILKGAWSFGGEGWVVLYWILVPFLLSPFIPALVSWARWEELAPSERLRMNLPLAVASVLVGVILWGAA